MDYDFELRDAALAVRKDELALQKEFDKLAELELVEEVKSHLVNAKAEDTSLLTMMTPALETVGVDCTSNVSAAKGIDALLKSDVSEEVAAIPVVITAMVVSIITSILAKSFGLIGSYGSQLTKIVAKLKQIKIGDKFHDSKLNVQKIETYSFEQFSKFVGAYTDCIKFIKSTEGKIDSASVTKIKGIMGKIGIKLTSDGSFEHSEKFVPQEENLKEHGWDNKAAAKAVSLMDILAQTLSSMKDVASKAKAAAKDAKAKAKTSDLGDEDKAKLKAKSEEIKVAGKFVAKFINNTLHKGWNFNVKLMCEDAAFVVAQYDSSKYKEKKPFGK